MLTICIGVDKREMVAFHVLCHSIMKRASRPVRIVPIKLDQIAHEYRRPYPLDEGASTEFAFSRFLTPYIAGHGVSVFMDCDMLCMADITELEDIALENMHSDVLVVKHDYTSRARKKFIGADNKNYPCKNWSSVMVFNGHRQAVRGLTPEYVSKASPMDLHQFKWAKSVGDLGKNWNHLVGEYGENPYAKIVHFTLGTPCFRDYLSCEYSKEWYSELAEMTSCSERTFTIIPRGV